MKTMLFKVTILLSCFLFLSMAPRDSQAAFDSSYYYPLDLDREARLVYGPTATAVAIGPHLWDWRAHVSGQYYSLDLEHAVSVQYGAGWSLVSIGVGKDDWRAVNLGQLSYVVLLVMEVASDRFFDVTAVSGGVDDFKSVLQATQNWYELRAGGTFRMLAPIVMYSSQSSSGWNALSASTQYAAHRYDLFNEIVAQYQAQLPMPAATVRIAAVPFSGASSSVYLGAAAGGQFAIAAPHASSLSCPGSGPQSTACGGAEYAIGHELGHLFGLAHSCDAYPSDPSCGNSIMQTAAPWDAILLPGEISTVNGSAFFD